MKRSLLLANRTLLTLLGVSTGAVKLAQMPEEMRIFSEAGFPLTATILLGVVQLAAALALLHGRSAKVGAGVLLASFVVASGVLFINAMIPFGVFSLSFIAMAGLAAANPAVGALFGSSSSGAEAPASSPAAR